MKATSIPSLMYFILHLGDLLGMMKNAHTQYKQILLQFIQAKDHITREAQN